MTVERRRGAWLAGLGTLAAAGSIVLLAGQGDEPQIDCVTVAEVVECAELAGPVPTSTSVLPPSSTTSSSTTSTSSTSTTSTTAPADPFANVASEFDTTVSGPWLKTEAWDGGDQSDEPSGNFRTWCEPSHLAYADPILDPGNPAFMHLHVFFGNTLADHDSTFFSLRSTGGGSCTGGPLNRSAYWVPAIFDGDGNAHVPSDILLYYKADSHSDISGLANKQAYIQSTVSYPNGFRYLGGRNPTTNTDYSDTYWQCSGGSNSGTTIPHSCPASDDWIVGIIDFPQCWNGEDLWLPDNAHVRAGNAGGAGRRWNSCPSGWLPLPHLTQLTYYDKGSDMSSWYLSSDRMDPNPANWYPNGASLHADWFGAWDHNVQEAWIDGCIRGMRNSTHNLCNGTELTGGTSWSGPYVLEGWTPQPPGHEH